MYGSLQNRLAEGKTFGKIKVGTGATEMWYTDRTPYEVVEVIDDKHLLVRECEARRIDNNGMSESQDYEYTLKPYEQIILTQEMLDNEVAMTMRKIHAPKLYERIMKSKVGDVVGDNNTKLVLTKKGWRERTDAGTLGNFFAIGFKEKYHDYSF